MMKLLIILLCIYLFFRLFAKPVLNFVFRMIFNKAYNNISKQQTQNSYHQNKPEGKVTVHKVEKNQNREGDFADYEEVK
jgi:hypothetical protein